MFDAVANPGATVIGYVDFKWALDLSAEKVSVTYGDLCLTLLELGLGDEDATRERGDDDEKVAAAESKWRAVEAEHREREMAAEMDRQRRLAETRRRRLESAGLPSAPPASPPTPSRARHGSQQASPRDSMNAGSNADADANQTMDEDGPAMKELKDYAADGGGGEFRGGDGQQVA